MKMQQILILILNVVILPCHLACAGIATVSTTTASTTTALKTDSACGIRTLPSLEGMGTETTVGKYPWVASIYFKDPSANEQAKLYGTASIVTDRHLITVANVVSSGDANSSATNPTNFFAVLGGKYGGDGLLFNILNIYKYFSTDDPILGGGLAIAQVENNIAFTDYIRPICLPEIQSSSYNQQQNQSLTAVGWHSDNSSETPVLYEINVQLQAEDYCQQFIHGAYPTDKLICGVCSEQETSKFGSGGPLMSSTNGKITMYGVADLDIGYELPNENTDVPIYFLKTNSFSHMSWITSIIQQPTE